MWYFVTKKIEMCIQYLSSDVRQKFIINLNKASKAIIFFDLHDKNRTTTVYKKMYELAINELTPARSLL